VSFKFKSISKQYFKNTRFTNAQNVQETRPRDAPCYSTSGITTQLRWIVCELVLPTYLPPPHLNTLLLAKA